MHRAAGKALTIVLLTSVMIGYGSSGHGSGPTNPRSSGLKAATNAKVAAIGASQAIGTPGVAVTRDEAFRFLTQATFGPTQADIDHLVSLGDSTVAYNLWIDEQLAAAPSLVLPVVQEAGQTIANPVPLNDFRQDAWFRNAMHGPDQLRQRVAFALSEMMVVSQNGALLRAPFATASYYDTLSAGALGNFRDLMQNVTLHPAMGVYLSMLGNRKPNTAQHIRPDENYARELMQLFTIGLYVLGPNGQPIHDATGERVPTYDQSVVEGFANVFTGWTYSGFSNFTAA